MDYPAEIFDRVQLLADTNGFNDHTLHCVLRFERAPDAEILRKSVMCSIGAIPILGTRFVDSARPHWTTLAAADLGRAFVTAPTETAFEAFVVARVDEGAGPQVRVCLLAADTFAVALKMNHMICDAAGFKQYLGFLCSIYAGLTADPAYRPAAITGDRSIRGVLKNFAMSVKLRSWFLQSKDNNRTRDHRFPLTEGGDALPFIVARTLPRDRVAALRAYCQARGATLNDAVLAAYYRCVFQRLALPAGAVLEIPVMVDMRRYLGDVAAFTSLTNLTSTVITRLNDRPQERFEGTLGRIKAVMDAKKGADIGLNGFMKLDLLYRIYGDRIANRRLRSHLKNPLICMTNVGILDSDRIRFGELRPRAAYMCGSIKHKPYFQLAMSSFDGELTLSVNLYGTGGDRERVLSFFDDIEAELPS
ncbi:MAG TPA: hypothetical protein VJY39_08545 [Acidisphaera sp.]|nr:hypothetical protein [Acidisphaera sp.]